MNPPHDVQGWGVGTVNCRPPRRAVCARVGDHGDLLWAVRSYLNIFFPPALSTTRGQAVRHYFAAASVRKKKNAADQTKQKGFAFVVHSQPESVEPCALIGAAKDRVDRGFYHGTLLCHGLEVLGRERKIAEDCFVTVKQNKQLNQQLASESSGHTPTRQQHVKNKNMNPTRHG